MKLLNLLLVNVCTVSIMGLALTGCDPVEDSEGSDQVEHRNGWGYTCPTWQCGFNSAEVNGRAIRELNVNGVANSAGMKIVGFTGPAGLLGYSLAVENDELVAKKTGAPTLRGAQLIGSIILLKEPGLLGLSIPITIAASSEIDSWATGAPDVPAYAFLYPDLLSLTGTRNVCNNGLDELLVSSAVVLGGETYNLTNKTVNANMNGWFTIACAGSAAAKMRLLNYGPQSNFDGTGQPATVAQRQATLKMLTADYCGNGTSYTANGTPLQYEDVEGTVTFSGTQGAPEAIWTAQGALCLDTTRIANTSVACNLPSCSSFDITDGVWATYVPTP
ncbi:MAG TPA: ADYC domain-containing protein [Nannocystis sp.]|jgi:hypothetical protein